MKPNSFRQEPERKPLVLAGHIKHAWTVASRESRRARHIRRRRGLQSAQRGPNRQETQEGRAQGPPRESRGLRTATFQGPYAEAGHPCRNLYPSISANSFRFRTSGPRCLEPAASLSSETKTKGAAQPLRASSRHAGNTGTDELAGSSVMLRL